MTNEKIAVLGAGTMGNGIAHVFAQSGYNTKLIDISQSALDKAMATIEKNMNRQVAKERMTEEEKQTALANISMSTSMAMMLGEADLIVEAAT